MTREQLYLVSEARIEEDNDAIVLASPELQEHVEIINRSLDFIANIPKNVIHRDEWQLVVQRLIVRCFNSAASSLRLARGGYYQPAFSMIRDLIETTFLLDLFERKPDEIRKWTTLKPKERESRFSTFAVRKKLDDFDGNKKSLRSEIFKALSTYAAHPTPEGFAIISPNMMTQVGPFPDAERMTAVLQELAKHVSYTAVVCGTHAPDDHATASKMKAEFLVPLNKWLGKYMPGAAHITL